MIVAGGRIQGLGISICRGTGRQKTGAIVLFVSNFVIALPVGVPLMFATNLGLPGNSRLNFSRYCFYRLPYLLEAMFL